MSTQVVLIRHNGLRQRWKRTSVSVIGLATLVLLSAIAARALASDGPRYPPAWKPGSGACPAPGGASAGGQTPAGLSTLSSAAVITDTEWIVLEQVAGDLGCAGDIWQQETRYTLSCMVAAGHSITVRIQRFASAVDALAAFDAARGGRPLQRFRCYPSCAWQYDESPTGLVMRHRIKTWPADRWLTYIDAFDDTGYPIAPAPAHVAELVDQAARDNGLFAGQPCTVICLPYGARP
jgi:hypothetical protein